MYPQLAIIVQSQSQTLTSDVFIGSLSLYRFIIGPTVREFSNKLLMINPLLLRTIKLVSLTNDIRRLQYVHKYGISECPIRGYQQSIPTYRAS